ncbi:MAG TPA: hypothetical protein VGX78_15405 [Pirellulales bacterium]|jgi:hypothetical protein|nr:hypothetical protein [Pirellulales bacterium]
MSDDFWSDRFHYCALAAGYIAASEGRLDDSEYVRRLAYELYERRPFRPALPGQVDTPAKSRYG